ncbi:cutinase family protein [Spongisporangium articulatum]|uniref:Cutinase family protein n=1 Tax=Spongisporangium articulatum TaxID=3362603 RepID=A0ABW8APJ6_9ACTN
MKRTRRMAVGTLAVLALCTVAAAPAAQAVKYTGTGCAAVEVISIRGQGEPAGSGYGGGGYVLGPMQQALETRLSQTVKLYPLPYSAGQDTLGAANQGIPLLIDHLVAQRSACPNQKFVILGFSLGALVAGEAFTPPSLRYSGVTKYALPTTVDSKVAAVAIFGDGRFNASGPEAYGTFVRGLNGQIPRPADSFSRFNGHIANVCNQYDGVCQAISNGQPSAHQDYVKYTDDLVWWVGSLVA